MPFLQTKYKYLCNCAMLVLCVNIYFLIQLDMYITVQWHVFFISHVINLCLHVTTNCVTMAANTWLIRLLGVEKEVFCCFKFSLVNFPYFASVISSSLVGQKQVSKVYFILIEIIHCHHKITCGITYWRNLIWSSEMVAVLQRDYLLLTFEC